MVPCTTCVQLTSTSLIKVCTTSIQEVRALNNLSFCSVAQNTFPHAVSALDKTGLQILFGEIFPTVSLKTYVVTPH